MRKINDPVWEITKKNARIPNIKPFFRSNFFIDKKRIMIKKRVTNLLVEKFSIPIASKGIERKKMTDRIELSFEDNNSFE